MLPFEIYITVYIDTIPKFYDEILQKELFIPVISPYNKLKSIQNVCVRMISHIIIPKPSHKNIFSQDTPIIIVKISKNYLSAIVLSSYTIMQLC